MIASKNASLTMNVCKMRQTAVDEKILERVINVARAAGRAILDIYREAGSKGEEIARKSDDSPLTLADLAAHRTIAEALDVLTPGIPVVSEEGDAAASNRGDADIFWLVDPLDGTREFLARNGEFTVNIALVCDGAPVWGIVHVPVSGLDYWGGKGRGAFRSDTSGQITSLRVSLPPAPGQTIRVIASKSHLNEETRNFIGRLVPHETLQAGSSLKFCRIAEGAADVYPRLGPTSEWDTAAAQAVLEGAGGHVLTLDGAPLRYGKTDILNPFFVAISAAPVAWAFPR